MEGLYRPSNGKMFAGVCAGLARRFGMSAGLVRVLFLISCLLPGPQFIVYLVLWIMMPTESKYRTKATYSA
ncbi:PspC domain-containing protein [Actinocorallia longicatena]|uniref:PspC domain-containing protein n=1 Tax=Actinocorallia longicatena TaxID=111803 RepID=A0ABP6QJE9_9ACTN